MARLLIHVEGQTEEDFVNEVLRNHLVARGYHSVDARIVGNARLRERRGGICPWPSVRIDIVNHLREDQDCIATTMVDYYGLPEAAPGEWPGRARSKSLRTTAEKAQCVQDAMRDNLVAEMGSSFNSARSDCTAFSSGIGRPNLEAAFQIIRDQFTTPEEIDDSPVTAPSKRVQALVPGYQKPLLGVLAVLEIGLAHIQEECPLFRTWLTQLETLLK